MSGPCVFLFYDVVRLASVLADCQRTKALNPKHRVLFIMVNGCHSFLTVVAKNLESVFFMASGNILHILH